jgi:hypothetical protein
MTDRPDDKATSGNSDNSDNPDNSQNPERRAPPPNPLYHPLFLPILLVAFTLWFGYDAFLTTDPKMAEHQTFNRIMYLVMQPICFRLVPRGITEFLEDQQAEADAQSGSSAP